MKIFQLEIWKYSYKEFLSEITGFLDSKSPDLKGKSVFTPNPEICLRTLEDTEFLDILGQADYLTSDGIGLYLAYQINDILQPHFSLWEKIVWGLLFPYFLFNVLFRKKYLYEKYGERICGSDLTEDLVRYASHNNIRVSILDLYNPTDSGKLASQKVFTKKLQEAFPELLFDFYIYREEEKTKIFTDIQKSWSKIVFSTLGMKRQEQSILEVLDACPNIRLWLGIGSSFDYHIWYQKRAPKLFRDFGFEWFYRIFTSPNKLKRLGRIYQALIVFPMKILFYRW